MSAVKEKYNFLVGNKNSSLTPIGASKSSYFIGLNNRAMVSLGPAAPQKYCSFSCKFCYVHGPYRKNEPAEPSEIKDWLRENRDKFNIVYVSGDTDSFARPRTKKALELLDQLTELSVDVLFTTRYTFNEEELVHLEEIANKYKKNKKLLIGCLSVNQLHYPQLEPSPISSPQVRLSSLEKWKNCGIVNSAYY